MRFKNILIVTYGRSGSTLLQGLLNTIPSVLVRGENYNFCWGLFLSWKALSRAKEQYGVRQTDPTMAWFGADSLDPDYFIEQSREIVRRQLKIPPDGSVNCWGFKEIRFVENLTELPDFLGFLSKIFPDAAILFLTRSHDEVVRSAFWKRFDQEKLKALLQRADFMFYEIADLNPNCFIVRYERLVGEVGYIKQLYKYLGYEYNEDVAMDLLRKPHSFVPREETVARAMEKRTSQLTRSSAKLGDGEVRRISHEKVQSADVVVFSTVKNEILRLPYWLSHYRGLGCRHFVIIDNGSTDGTREMLLEQPDVTLYESDPEKFSASRFGINWINELTRKHALEAWVLVADADEILMWPNCEREGILGLVTRAERLGLNRIFTPLIDMYSDHPTSEMEPYIAGQSFSNYCQWTDPVSRAKALWKNGRLLIYSGPRMRILPDGERPPLMSKQSVFYCGREGFRKVGAHFDEFGTPSPLVAPLLHYKFLSDFSRRVETAILEGQHWDQAREYKNYARSELSRMTLKLTDSIRIASGDDLLEYTSVLSRMIREAGLTGSRHVVKVTGVGHIN